ncbi:protein Loquacious-like isoform X1 [Tachypleus tridentatus]|uniref:protein Loquacious-like isoform X1 n=2 Tax=Tachypleus tridentatus TaxID=6853 RepID=UPI003FD5FED6
MNLLIGMETLPQKTPISLLQELCARHGLTADYKMMSVEGLVHAPTFMFRVEVDNEYATATGQSKKKAKHAAAQAILEKLLEQNGLFSSSVNVADNLSVKNVLKPSEDKNCEKAVSPYSDGITGNPVGTLQELCMKNHWEPPLYETVQEEGLPHERIFGVQCQVKLRDKNVTEDKEIKEIGIGKSKRLAKHQAAFRILQILEGVEVVEQKLPIKPVLIQNHYKQKTKKLHLPTPDYSQNVLNFIHGLQSSDGEILYSLHMTDLNKPTTDFIGLLQDIADEQNFETNYWMLEEKSFDGNYQCLVHLGSLPAAVCFGVGNSSDEAKENAARNALQYLRIMTRK